MRLSKNLRLARSKEERLSELSSRRGLTVLEKMGIIAQIFLSLVAIFGYFYTVRPIYQKEQLAEQVAEYDSIIKKQTPKIREIESQVSQLQSERSQVASEFARERAQLESELQRERGRLSTELGSIEKQLAIAKEEKRRIEGQIEFMTFRYRLPDGRPAVTREEVRIAQRSELRRSLLSAVSIDCSYGAGPFRSYVYIKPEPNDQNWPFTAQELSTWRESGARYPAKRVTECIESAIARAARLNPGAAQEEVEAFRKEAIEFVERETAKPWVPPFQPQDLINEIAARRVQIEKEQLAELKEVDEKYKDWESAFGADRRVILKNNYDVEKQNARTHALSKTWEVEAKVRERADLFRKAVNEEIKRLVLRDGKPER
jgi:hypothetical protein